MDILPGALLTDTCGSVCAKAIVARDTSTAATKSLLFLMLFSMNACAHIDLGAEWPLNFHDGRALTGLHAKVHLMV
jgi:hypothetical protein